MQTENKGVETPQTENETIENLQNPINTITAHRVMERELENCSQYLDNQKATIDDFQMFSNNMSTIKTLTKILPTETVAWAVQKSGIVVRIYESSYCNWYNDRKVLTLEDYCNLERAINKDRQGITMNELITITGKSEEELLEILEAHCGLITINHNPVELVMYTDLYVNLIPLVNIENQLTGEFRVQYLFKDKAISCFAENLEDYEFMERT